MTEMSRTPPEDFKITSESFDLMHEEGVPLHYQCLFSTIPEYRVEEEGGYILAAHATPINFGSLCLRDYKKFEVYTEIMSQLTEAHLLGYISSWQIRIFDIDGDDLDFRVIRPRFPNLDTLAENVNEMVRERWLELAQYEWDVFFEDYCPKTSDPY